MLARRLDLLEAAAADAGAGAFALRCDVADEASCRSAIDAAAARMGGIDAVLYCPAVGVLSPIEELDRATWDEAFTTNVVGAWSITTAALGHLRSSGGTAAFLSSVSASMSSPWPGLAAYTVTKAALDKLVDAWRGEHPEVGFTRIVVGECAGGEGDGATQLASGWEPSLAAEYFARWYGGGFMTEQLVEVDHLVDAVHAVLHCGPSATIPTVAITPRRPI